MDFLKGIYFYHCEIGAIGEFCWQQEVVDKFLRYYFVLFCLISY